jgi:hypothetical protein
MFSCQKPTFRHELKTFLDTQAKIALKANRNVSVGLRSDLKQPKSKRVTLSDFRNQKRNSLQLE